MRTYKVELTYSEACEIESAMKRKIKIYNDFLSDAVSRNDNKAATTWQEILDNYHNIKSKMQTITQS